MIEDKATEKLKKRAQDAGLIVNADAGETQEAIAAQTKTTRQLDRTVKRDAEDQMARKKKAVERWEDEGGTVVTKKGGKR